jgi:hypothetical protein
LTTDVGRLNVVAPFSVKAFERRTIAAAPPWRPTATRLHVMHRQQWQHPLQLRQAGMLPTSAAATPAKAAKWRSLNRGTCTVWLDGWSAGWLASGYAVHLGPSVGPSGE